jgi:HK97 family phage major capsid protein
MTNLLGGLSSKADIALTDLNTNGGLLQPEQNDVFFRKLLDEPTLLNQVRSIQMNAPQQDINKIGIGTRVFHGAGNSGNGASGLNDANVNGRVLAAAKRTSVTTSKISMNSTEVIAEVRIPYEVLEDNLERGGLQDTILALVAQRGALDFETLLISGDKTINSATDDLLCLQNGILKGFTSNVVDAAGETLSLGLWNRLKKALPTAYRRNLQAMRFFSSMDKESDWRVTMAGRPGALGDSIATGGGPVPALGVQVAPAALMPDANIIFTDPKNIIWGLQRNVRIETDKDIRSREVIFVITARVAINIEEELAGAKLINLG